MLFCTAAFAQELPRIAVYVTGDVPENEKRALGTRMLASFINSGRYRGIERSNTFLAEIEKEQVTQRSGSIDDSQISALGKRFGVRYICIADIIPAFGSFQISARIVDVETAEVIFIGEAFSPLKSANDLTQVSDEVVKIMFRGQVASKPQPQPQPLPTPAPEPKPILQPEPQPKPLRTTDDVMRDGRRRAETQQKEKAVDKPPKSPSFWAGIGLEVLGTGLIVYGLIEDRNVGVHNDNWDYSKAEKSVNSRNFAYGVGAALLLSGISIHLFF